MKQEYLYKYRAIENLDRDLAMIANDSFLLLALQTSMMIGSVSWMGNFL